MGSSLADLVDGSAAAALGGTMHDLVAELFGVCRSITGDGVRTTLGRVAAEIPLVSREVPSGTQVLDWTIPDEWTVRDAYIADTTGRRVVDFRESNLHLVSYSTPVRTRMPLSQLREHLHSLPEQPDRVPYRTSYYARSWGFCLTHEQLQGMDDGPYDVVVDTTLAPGSLTYGECVLPGTSPDEVLVSTHVCHPSLANDNLSGIAVATALARLLAGTKHRYTYRFVMVPGTIGALTWLSERSEVLRSVRHGLVLTGLGGPGPLHYKATRDGGQPVDAAARAVVGGRGGALLDYAPWGYDERQYNAPGIDLPVGRLTRTPHGEYPEYHTSGDDLGLVSPGAMADALAAVLEVLDVLEHDTVVRRVGPAGEPQLGRRGLYPSVGGRSADEAVMAMLWVLGLADGKHTLLDVAGRAGLPFAVVRRTADLLREHALVELDGR